MPLYKHSIVSSVPVSLRRVIMFSMALFFVVTVQAATPPSQIRILYISSLETDSSETAKVIEVLKEDLVACGWRPEIYLESLDTFRLQQTADTRQLFDDTLSHRYANLRFSIILAQASDAVKAAERYRQSLSYDLPVYCFDWIDISLQERYSGMKGFYGRTLVMTFPPTLRLAAKFFPDAKRAYIVASPIDPEYIPAFRRDIAALQHEFPRLELISFENAGYEEVRSALENSDGTAFTLLLPGEWWLANGEHLGGRAALDRMDAAAPMPYFGMTMDAFGSGLIGGYFADREVMGREAARMIISILGKGPAPTAWCESEALIPTLDYRALKRFDVDLSLVPPDARIQYAPVDFWIRYESQLKLAGIILLLLFIALLVYNLVRRRERKFLRIANENLEKTVERRTAELTGANLELKAANESLRRTMEELEEAKDRIFASEKLAALGRLTANISHELNTPLAAMSSASHSVIEYLYSGMYVFFSNPMSLDGKAFGFIREAMERSKKSGLNISSVASAAERRAGHDAAAVLKSAGLDDADSIAQELSELGIADLADRALPFLTGPGAETFVAVLRATLGSLHGAAIVEEAVSRASRVIALLRTYTRSGEFDEPRSIRIAAELNSVLGLFSQLNRETSIEMSVRDDIEVYSRLEDFKTILFNIIKNAIQAVQNSGRIGLSAEEKEGFVYISVSDTGSGIPESIKARIFEPFFSTKPLGEGAGFGLDVARRLARKNGGEIVFESNPGKTVFTVSLPADSNKEAERG